MPPKQKPTASKIEAGTRNCLAKRYPILLRILVRAILLTSSTSLLLFQSCENRLWASLLTLLRGLAWVPVRILSKDKSPSLDGPLRRVTATDFLEQRHDFVRRQFHVELVGHHRQAPEFGLLDWRKVARLSRSPPACHEDKEKVGERKEGMKGLHRKLIKHCTPYERHALNVFGREGLQGFKAGVSEL